MRSAAPRSERPRHLARRNPRTNPAPKHPMVVLVRRFDPTGEELTSWKILYRDDEGATFFSPPKARAAALAPPRDADLHVGDLLVTVPAEAAGHDEYVTGLFVVTPDGVKTAPRPPKWTDGSWLTAWGQDATPMFDEAGTSRVNRRRVVMAACDCAETVLHFARAGDDRPRMAIETARAWCLGRATIGAVRSATEFPARHPAEAAAQQAAQAALDYSFAGVVVYHATQYATASGTTIGAMRHSLAQLVDRWIPLPVVLLSRLGYPNAIPFDPSMVPASVRENPSRARRRRTR